MWKKWCGVLSEECLETVQEIIKRAEEYCPSMLDNACDILTALSHVGPEDISVLIAAPYLYRNPDGKPVPPCMTVMLRELASDVGCEPTAKLTLEDWAKQGVVYLNTTLVDTLAEDIICHDEQLRMRWISALFEVIAVILNQPQPVVCMAWGFMAQCWLPEVEVLEYPKKVVLSSTDPDPVRGYVNTPDCCAFSTSRPFSRANDHLVRMGSTSIVWA